MDDAVKAHSWGDLPQDLLVRIVDASCKADRFPFSLTCKSWNCARKKAKLALSSSAIHYLDDSASNRVEKFEFLLGLARIDPGISTHVYEAAFHPSQEMAISEAIFPSLLARGVPFDPNRLLVAAARRGSVRILDVFSASPMFSVHLAEKRNFINVAAAEGNKEAIQWGMRQGWRVSPGSAFGASVGKHWDLVKFLLINGADFYMQILEQASKACHFEMMEFLLLYLDHKGDDGRGGARALPNFVGQCAAYQGDIEVLNWAFLNDILYKNDAILEQAVAGGRFDSVQWCHDNIDITGNCRACCCAIRKNSLEMLDFLLQGPLERLCSMCLATAIKTGMSEVTQFVYEHGAPVSEPALIEACRGEGDVDVLEWLWTRGGVLTARVMRAAARYGGLSCVTWLLEHSCPMDTHAAVGAHAWKQQECFKALLKAGCPCPAHLVPEGMVGVNKEPDVNPEWKFRPIINLDD